MSTEIVNRKDIMKIADISRSKMLILTANKKFNFPNPIGTLDRSDVWQKKEVMAWLKNNDINSMHKPAPKGVAIPYLDNSLARQFIIGARL